MSAVLTYNIEDPKKKELLIRLSIRFNYKLIPVSGTLQSGRIRDILTGQAVPSTEPNRFTDEMMVIHDFPPQVLSFLLDELSRNSLTVRLKAVTTPVNLQWTGAELHSHLLAEYLWNMK